MNTQPRFLLATIAGCAVSFACTMASAQIASIGPTPTPLGGFNAFRRGDANTDGLINIADAVAMLGFLFPPGGGPATVLTCRDAGDVNDDETLNIADPVNLLTHLFSFGPPPPPPFAACGNDPTLDSILTCNSYPPCVGTTDRDLAGHVLRRVAYGPTRELLDAVETGGALPYIAEQLDPDSIDESGNALLNSLLAAITPQSNLNDLYELQIIRGCYSEKQLLEQLTDFWNNHFNTYYWTVYNHFRNLEGSTGAQVYPSSALATPVAVLQEYNESEAFRAGALGSFHDLLVESATSVAMLIYLDNISNVASGPNENYARELLELSTVGVSGGYSQNDIEELARCFTGWTICKVAAADVDNPHAPCLLPENPAGVWAFHFEPANHDYGQKILFGGAIPQLIIPAGSMASAPLAGINDGMMVLEHLAGIQNTAQYVSSKLISKFVSDSVPPALLAACIGTWLATDGDLTAVMDTILTSNEFLGATFRWNKIETPMESLISMLRAYDGVSNATSVVTSLSRLNHLPFNFSTPDGFPESDSLGSTAKLLERITYAQIIYKGTTSEPTYDLISLLQDYGVTLSSADQIVDFFLDVLMQSNFSVIDRQLAIDFLSTSDTGVATPLVPGTADHVARVKKVAALLASYPQANKQ
ncbi:MAG: DUF1800 family protein [Planctomycetota bacterium]